MNLVHFTSLRLCTKSNKFLYSLNNFLMILAVIYNKPKARIKSIIGNTENNRMEIINMAKADAAISSAARTGCIVRE